MTYLAKPKLHHPTLPTQQARLHAARLRRQDLDAVRRLRPRLDLGRDHPGLLGARHRAAPRRQAVGHRLHVEDARLLPRRLARLQHRARPHALGADRRQPRQPRPALPRRVAATATRRRSASASSRTPCGAACNMVYIVENNGVYGLTKGQFSATADQGSKSKKGVVNTDSADRPGRRWRCSSAPPTSRAASPATRSSWCR